MVEHLAVDAEAGDRVVHPVERAHDRALAAAGGADHRRDDVLVDRHVDALDGQRRPVEEVDVAQLEDDLAAVMSRRVSRARSRAARSARLSKRRSRACCLPSAQRSSSCSGLGSSCLIFRRWRSSIARAPRLPISMSAIRTSAAPQARAWSAGAADSETGRWSTGMFGSAVPKMLIVVLLREDRVGQEQRRGLAGCAGDGEHGAGEDPAERARQDDADDRAPAAHAERVRGVAQLAWDELQHLAASRARSAAP